MTRTERWIKENGMTEADAIKAGLLPRQQSARARRALPILEKHGQKNTEAYSMISKQAEL